MVLDSATHKQFLLELIKQTNMPGTLLDLAYEVKQAVLKAEIVEPVVPLVKEAT